MYGPLFLHFVGSDEQRAFVSNEEAMRTEIAASLARLGVDYIDCYLLHRDDREHPIGELVSFMDSMCVSGVFRSWGVSNMQLDRVVLACEYAQRNGLRAPAADSPQCSLAQPVRAVWPNTTFLSPDGRAEWLAATRGNVAQLSWECLAKGFMCGKWGRDGASSAELQQREIMLTSSNAPEWRDMQLRIDENFDRCDRVGVPPQLPWS